MAKSKIFEYAIIHHPRRTKAMEDAGEAPKSVIVADVTRILAADEREATLVAARAIPEAFLGKLDEVELAIRPF